MAVSPITVQMVQIAQAMTFERSTQVFIAIKDEPSAKAEPSVRTQPSHVTGVAP
jgi:hypothetical protein